ncbi:MAG TPA: orotidine-5'-phosphate decarboxylase [Gaiellaceae bacterium]|nr:orotidine-5'-phosphate decarboxylase [Gaiellaceae bacterium]
MWSLVQFSDRLADAVARKRSQLVVGIDPVPERLPAGVGLLDFCRGIVDAVAESAVAVKPQAAFFEALGPSGWAAYAEVCEHAREAGLLVIADAKRGDVGSTARAYAAAFLEFRGDRQPLADALTVNPYLGRDSLEPFLAACREHGGGLFCLVKTSNPGGGDVQDVQLAGGGLLWEHVARLVDAWGSEHVGQCGLSDVGAVVGATYPREVARARELLPRTIFLLPGVGAQGGKPADLAPAFAPGPAGGLVAASRSVIYAYRDAGGDFRTAAAAEAERLARETWSVSEAA